MRGPYAWRCAVWLVAEQGVAGHTGGTAWADMRVTRDKPKVARPKNRATFVFVPTCNLLLHIKPTHSRRNVVRWRRCIHIMCEERRLADEVVVVAFNDQVVSQLRQPASD